MGKFRMLGPLTTFSWGGNVRLPFGWWLVWSTCDWPRLYISNDATPPDGAGVRGFFLYWGKHRP
jgi:hypothetical protein